MERQVLSRFLHRRARDSSVHPPKVLEKCIRNHSISVVKSSNYGVETDVHRDFQPWLCLFVEFLHQQVASPKDTTISTNIAERSKSD
jgi:hypothetical protein